MYGGHGIQEVSGSIPLISTKSPENHWFSGLFLLFFGVIGLLFRRFRNTRKTGFLLFVHAVIVP